MAVKRSPLKSCPGCCSAEAAVPGQHEESCDGGGGGAGGGITSPAKAPPDRETTSTHVPTNLVSLVIFCFPFLRGYRWDSSPTDRRIVLIDRHTSTASDYSC